VGALREEVGRAREAAREETLKQGLGEVGSLVERAERVDGTRVVTGQVVAADVRGLRQISDDVKNRLGGPAAVVLAAALDGKAVLVANLHPEVAQKVAAGDIVREVSGVLGGGGGGGPTMAQAGGGNLEAIPDALAKVREILDRRLAGSE
jgi:alanyl-tRNA synthetase